MKRSQQRSTEMQSMDFRSFGVRAQTVDEQGRTVEADIATETPVREMDWKRYEMVDRVLLSSGVVLPESRQVPLLDNHNRNSTQDQIGSIRNLRIEDGRVRGDLHFSSTASDAFTKVREGHITDVSAGFDIQAETYIEDGVTATIGGRTFTGPVNVATQWKLREGSITPIGADEQAKLRGLQPRHSQEERDFQMNEELRKLCIERGMKSDLTDEQAQKWMLENKERLFAPAQASEPEQRKIGTDGSALGGEVLTRADLVAALDEMEKRREEKRAAFRKEVESLCELAGITFDRSFADAPTLEEARKLIVDARSQAQQGIPGARIRFADEQPADRGRQAIGSALTLRAMQDCNAKKETIDGIFPAELRSKDAEKFRHASLIDLARTCLEFEGIDCRNMSRENIALAALGFYEQAGIQRSGGAYHVTSNFSKLTQDAINKSMMVGYTEAPSTWQGPMRQGSSVADFKTIHRLRLGAVPNLPIWIDNTDPEKASMADAEETYGVECYSLELNFSYKLLANDDMDSLSRMPSQMGSAARRTVNKIAWSQVTSNPLMSDGQALFLATATGNRKRSNLTTGSVSDYTAALNTMTTKMMQMRGENTPEGAEGDDVLSLMPTYIVAPAALRQTILQLVRSSADPSAEHAGVVNVNNYLTPVIEPLLDASSTTAFYLFASTSQIDTVEVTFLQGQESPVTRSWMDPRTLSQNTTILQTVGVKAMNHRGIQKHAGA